MKEAKAFLRVAGVIYGITGCLFLPFFSPFGVFLFIVGIFLFMEAGQGDEVLYQRRYTYLVLGILCLFSFLGSIFVLAAYDNICRGGRGENAPPRVIYKKDPESRKIDLLLKLGILMIFVSGLLFATTSWDMIQDYVKALALLLFGGLFLGLSLFTERKLKLYTSSYMYWLLSISFFLLTIVGILYFGVFGEFLTYHGEGRELAFMISYLTASGLVYVTYLKFPKKYLLYVTYSCVVLFLAYAMASISLSDMVILSILSFLGILFHAFSFSDTFKTFNKMLSYVLFLFIVSTSSSALECLIACFIHIINLNYLVYSDKEGEEGFLNVILTYILILFAFSHFDFYDHYEVLFMSLCSGIYALMIHSGILSSKKNVVHWNYLFFTFCSFWTFLSACFMGSSFHMFSISAIYLLVNILFEYGLFQLEKNPFAMFLEPVALMIVVLSASHYFLPNISGFYAFSMAILVYSIMHYLSGDEKHKYILLLSSFFCLFVSFVGCGSLNEIFSIVIAILCSLYYFSYFFIDNDKSKVRFGISYVLLLSSLYVPFVAHNIFHFPIWFLVILNILVILIISFSLNIEIVRKISYFYVVLPLISLIDQSNVGYSLQNILWSILILYLVFLFIKFFVRDKSLRNILAIVGLFIALWEVFWDQELISGIYIGIVGLFIMIATYRNNYLYATFVFGIVLTLFNIIVRLEEVWKMIPFWLYLLLGGLGIVGFVTYREMMRQKKNEGSKRVK